MQTTKAYARDMNAHVRETLGVARELAETPGAKALSIYLLATVEQLKEQLVVAEPADREAIAGGIQTIRTALDQVYTPPKPAPDENPKPERPPPLGGAIY
jgi:hypothetical protein